MERLFLPKAASDFKKLAGFVIDAVKDRRVGVAKRAANGEAPRKDFAHYLLEAKDPQTGEGYTAKQMNTELRFLIGAGGDTTSTTLAATLYYITRNPEALRKVQAEIRSTFSDVNDIVSGPKLSSCHYLRAVIEEALRLAPAVPSALKRRTTVPLIIGDIAVPANTDVAVAAWGIHRSEAYFTEANKFKPERWLPEHTSKEKLDLMKTGFAPFSLGNRGCIGRNMAYNELSIGLGRLYWTCDMRLLAGDETGNDGNDHFDLIDCYITRKTGPMVEFRECDIIS